MQADHRVLIRCQAMGSPPPRVMWKYEDIPVSSQNSRYNIHHDGSLEILQVAVYDAGKYTCMAKNIAGNDTREVDLRVHGKYTPGQKNPPPHKSYLTLL